MRYSEFQKRTNPISAARLDAAFESSKMEGGPGDPVKVTVDKDQSAGTVTVSKFSQGKEKQPLSEPEKKAANDRWAAMSEEEKQAARERGKARELAESERNRLSSFTYEKLPFHNAPELELIKEGDLDLELEIEEEKEREDDSSENPTGGFTYTVSSGGGNRQIFDGSGIRKIQSTARNIKNRCRQGFFQKGNKCVKRGEKSINRQLRKR